MFSKSAVCLMKVIAAGILAVACGLRASPALTPFTSQSDQDEKTIVATKSVPLRALAEKRGFLIGAAFSNLPLMADPFYGHVAAREFNLITPEYEMNWKFIHPARNRYNFFVTDKMVAFAEAHKMKVYGHMLLWHMLNPRWLEKGKFTRDENIEILRDHITTVMTHYRGRVGLWVVVNEAIDENKNYGLRETIWSKGIGDDYIELAFRMAHDADPGAILIYNDYGADNLGKKSDAIYRMVKSLKEKGVPIHGVGFQMHLMINQFNQESLVKNLQRFAELGLNVYITEMDVMLKKGDVTPEMLQSQAKIYGDALDACLSQPACKSFETWGFTDRHSWIPHWFKGYGDALILNRVYRPKPAYQAIQKALMK